MMLRDLMIQHGITHGELARELGLNRSSISLKLSGRRPWFQVEINGVLAFLAERTGHRFTYEKVFGKAA